MLLSVLVLDPVEREVFMIRLTFLKMYLAVEAVVVEVAFLKIFLAEAGDLEDQTEVLIFAMTWN